MMFVKYTETHEWVLEEGKIATIGITNHAKGEIGEIVHVELPKIGAFLKAKDDLCVLESTKAAIVIPSPISGKIIAVNREISTNLDLINKDPEKGGWLCCIEFTEPKELEELLSRLKYYELIKKET